MTFILITCLIKSQFTTGGLELRTSCIRCIKGHTYLKKPAAENSIPEILSLNIFIDDIFSIVNNIDFVSYANDNTPYIVDARILEVIKTLTHVFAELFCFFLNNQMKPNIDKCQVLTSSNKELSIW